MSLDRNEKEELDVRLQGTAASRILSFRRGKEILSFLARLCKSFSRLDWMIAPPGNLLLLHSDLNPGRRFLLSWWYRARWLFSAPSRWQWPVVEGSRAAFKSISPVPWTSRFPSCSPLLFVSSFLPLLLLLLLFLPPSTSPFSFAWAQGPRSIEDPMERERERKGERLSSICLICPLFCCSCSTATPFPLLLTFLRQGVFFRGKWGKRAEIRIWICEVVKRRG